jgi:hypothetical protein
VPSQPVGQDSTELQALEEYRRTVHNTLQNLLAKDIERGRSRFDVKHRGSFLKITLFFNDQGKLENAIISQPSKFELVDKYYLKAIKRLADRGDISPPPIEMKSFTIPIELK